MPDTSASQFPRTVAAGGVPLIRFDGVSKSYDGGRSFAVRRLDLDVGEGEFLTLLGPSGSGKTTTLMMLAGFEDPSGGDIVMDGRSILDRPPNKRGFGVVFQSYALFPHMTIAENLAFPLKVRGMTAAERTARIRRALDMVDLGVFADRRPTQMSGGQQQRVALARALVFEPRLVLMDEPLGALDKRLRDQMQIELKALQRRLGVTIVYVTHDQIEALSMSDRIVVFNRGGVEQVGSPEAVYHRPASLFVASFMGENNRLPGTVADRQGDRVRVRLATGGTEIEADSDADLSPGDAAAVCVRPESIRIAEPGQGWAGVVEELMPLGDQLRLRVRCPELAAEALTVKAPSEARHGLYAINQPLHLAWNRADALAFRQEQGR